MIEFRFSCDDIGSPLYTLVERAVGSYPWSPPYNGYNRVFVTLIKFRAKKLGFRLVINQRYDKRLYLRSVKFNTDLDYTMFLLKWTI